MSRPLYYTLRRNFSGELTVIAVVTARGSSIWCQNLSGVSVNVSRRDTIGRFATSELALAALPRIAALLAKHDPKLADAKAALGAAESARDDDIAAELAALTQVRDEAA